MKQLNKKFRNEFKYYLNIYDYLSLKQKLTQLLTLDKNSISEEGYGIRSLYFDGVTNHALYDKNDGIFGREKYRIRIYNGSDTKISLERKSKYGDYVNKEAAPISKLEYESILQGEYNVLSTREESLIKDFYAALQFRHFQPVVIVDYIREAYVYGPGNVRVTFDKKLAAAVNTLDVFDSTMLLEEVLNPQQMIMEVKFDEFLPDVIRQLLQPEKFVRSAISKYVLCREIKIKHFK